MKGKTAKETTVVSVVKMISFIFDQGGDAVVILDKIRQGAITAAQRKFTVVIQREISGGRRMDCPFGIWSLLPGMLQDVCVSLFFRKREKVLLVVDRAWCIKDPCIVLGSMKKKKAILFILTVF